MAHLFEQQDYRAWLVERTEEIQQHKPFFSYRYVAGKLEINPAHWTRILQKKKHLSMQHLPKLSRIYSLEATEEKYLEALVQFNRARSAKECQKYFLEMQAIRGVKSRTVEDARHEYFSSYRHVAMRTLLSILNFQGKRYDRLGRLFSKPLSAEEAQSSVEVLERLGLIQQDEQGCYRAVDRVLSSGDGWMSEAVGNFQRETIALAGELFQKVPRQERDISTLTIPMSSKYMDELRIRIREFRQQIIQWSQTLDQEDGVYQLNLQVFPIAKVPLSAKQGA